MADWPSYAVVKSTVWGGRGLLSGRGIFSGGGPLIGGRVSSEAPLRRVITLSMSVTWVRGAVPVGVLLEGAIDASGDVDISSSMSLVVPRAVLPALGLLCVGASATPLADCPAPTATVAVVVVALVVLVLVVASGVTFVALVALAVAGGVGATVCDLSWACIHKHTSNGVNPFHTRFATCFSPST